MALTQVQGGMILPSTTLTTPIVATTIGVGGATPSTSGSGITFPATQSASSDANTLDDYEEGTYTATITCDSGSITVRNTANTLWYVKIGRQVNVSGYIQTSAVSSPTGTLKVSLPFTTSNTTNLQYSCLVLPNSLASGSITNFWAYMDSNSPTINIFLGGGTGVSATAAQTISANTEFRVSATYYV
jgi:hypothetical protein